MRKATIAAFICELIETHMEWRSVTIRRTTPTAISRRRTWKSRPPHIVSETDQQTANINEIRTSGLDGGRMVLMLDNGDVFHITVSKEA